MVHVSDSKQILSQYWCSGHFHESAYLKAVVVCMYRAVSLLVECFFEDSSNPETEGGVWTGTRTAPLARGLEDVALEAALSINLLRK